MVVSTRTFEELALANKALELHRGVVREKPPMSMAHDYATYRLTQQLILQLDPDRFWIFSNASRLKRQESTYYIPDIVVVPVEQTPPDRSQWNRLHVYVGPLPLVVEIWSASTGDYDIDEKIPEYMARGDREIWRLYPFERTLTAWRRRPDETYEEVRFGGGNVRPAFLPDVVIDLDALFP